MNISRRDAVKLFAGTIPAYYASRAVVFAANTESAKPEPLFNILLGRPTDKSVTANIITKEDIEFYVEYGKSSGKYSNKTKTFKATAKEPVEFVIDGLTPNAKNFYRIFHRQKGATEWKQEPEYAVQTKRSSDKTFTFTMIADSHLGQFGGKEEDEQALYLKTLSNVLADTPDFHIDLGDTFAMDPLQPYGTGLGTGMTEENADAAYYLQRPYLNTIGAQIPFFYVLGNHENEEGWNWDDKYEGDKKSVGIVGMKARKKYFPNPIPDDFYSGNDDALPPEYVAEYPELSKKDPYRETYFAWEWGDALFVVIEPYHYSKNVPTPGTNQSHNYTGGEEADEKPSGDRWNWTLGIKQYLWLKKTLEKSNATYKFVFAHHVAGGATTYGRGGIEAAPYFEWGGKNADGTWGWDTHRPASEGWTVPIHQLFKDNKICAFIHGHDHVYACEELDGIAYLEVPKPNDTAYDWRNDWTYGYNENLYPNAISLLPNSGHIRVTVSPEEAKFEYVRSYLPGAVDPYNPEAKNGDIAHSFSIKGINLC